MDAHNRIRLIDQPLTIEKKKQYGKYVSLFAFGGQVKGLTLRGFFYPLTEYDMEAENPLGVSNEITCLLDTSPDSAVCNEGVKLAQRKGFFNLKGFVNGVLRSVARNLDKVKYPDPKEMPVPYLCLLYTSRCV